MTAEPWRTRFAPHIGLTSPDTPLFPHLAGSASPLEQIAFIADMGFAGTEDNFFSLRPLHLQIQIGAELARRNLEMGCIVNNVRSWQGNIWCSGDPDDLEAAKAELAVAIAAADRCGGSMLSTVTAMDKSRPREVQIEAYRDTLCGLRPPPNAPARLSRSRP